MTVQTTTTVILHPVDDREAIKKYEDDKCWRKISESTIANVYELKSPSYVIDTVYLPSSNPYDREESEDKE